MSFREMASGRAARRSIVIGVVVAVLVLLGGVAYALTQQRAYTAESMMVVLPATNLDETTSASYYETLSRGQIVATFAEVAAGPNFKQQAQGALALSPEEAATITTEVTVVPNTSVILIRSTAPTAELAEKMVAATTKVSVAYLASLSQPYRVVPVPTGKDAAELSGFSPLVLIGAAFVVALVAGIAVQQAVYHLTVALRGGTGRAVPGEPEPPIDPESPDLGETGAEKAPDDPEVPGNTGGSDDLGGNRTREANAGADRDPAGEPAPDDRQPVAEVAAEPGADGNRTAEKVPAGVLHS